MKRKRRGTKLTACSDSDLKEDNLPVDGRVKLVVEKEELLKAKYKGIQDKVLRSYAEMKNVMDRTRHEAENSKKFANQVGFQWTPSTRRVGLPDSRALYTVLRSPHIDKKSREQFEMKVKRHYVVIKTDKNELRKKLFWLKRRGTWNT